MLSNLVLQAQADSITGFLKYHGPGDGKFHGISKRCFRQYTIKCEYQFTGHFVFQSVSSGSYILTASTSLDPGGIDLGIHFWSGNTWRVGVHLQQFNIWLQMSMASGTVTWADYWTIVIGWFTQGYPFPAGDWVFEEHRLQLVRERISQ